MECLLLAGRLLSMHHLLLPEDLEGLLFMVVIVHWEQEWATMVVLDQLSRPRLLKALQEAVHSVALMIRLLVVHTQLKTNSTTMQIKVLKVDLVMT
jgi:hypothetical protein